MFIYSEISLQINPEYILAIDFGAILLLQVLISHIAQRIKVFTVLVIGTLCIGLSYILTGLAHTMIFAGIAVSSSVFLFAIGEMLASPKSQEYVASIAPKNDSALYMGYYFVSMALGFLFAGLLSGWAYSTIAKEMQQPGLMWILFAGVGLLAAVLLIIFNLINKHRH